MKQLSAAALGLCLVAGEAAAIVGGADDTGPLARATVMVLNSQGGMCSAVVVARDAVLTAAHCVTTTSEHRVHFRTAGGEPVLIEPADKAVHPAYDAKAVAARRRSIDLALVRLPDPLPERLHAATLAGAMPPKDASLTVAGWGVAREGETRSTGTFRAADLRAVEPHGKSTILVWAEGAAKGAGACTGDSGGPLTLDGAAVFAVTTWATGPKGRRCGALTQGILLGPQRAWIDRTLAGWGAAATWE
ncbi:MAG TPA: trypsin-like serine protease [Microvirga sp.]|nr:trypsin-like serine protease [Microvirga sp.]